MGVPTTTVLCSMAYDQIHAALLAQMAKRDGTLGFVEDECQAVVAAANDFAHRHGQHTIDIDQVHRLDRVSTGTDWAEKLAWRAAELVVGLAP